MTFIANLGRNPGDPKILSTGPSSLTNADRLAKMLGWFSIGLGLTEIFAARRIARGLGMQGRETLVRGYGFREIAAGVATLSPEKQLGLWSRVGGDGLDIATLLTGLGRDNPKRGNVGLALTLVLGVTLLDIVGAQALGATHRRTRGDAPSYRDRSGFPRGLQAARDAARRVQSPDRTAA
ncbi:hypothetical protein M2323_004066 [Rhodoblastus acidophilus]|uniref:hypothetical protein n=1 Tax=Rhodoblastus acidophilus TaxID=1074 RepID=UPI0022247E13|nr:hypothetical protein [Rhodoblastus acidophilus]MCW2286196.1 hypothetical protein [Rhodoblastus acidophilus]MCW2335122.1 hypothetical protein [Rhodoblastus acidophilus]